MGGVAWLQLPKRVVYSLKALCCLACRQGPVRTWEVSQCAGIPPAETGKILYLLTWGGFVRSRRGSKGGFWLRLPPHRIRVRDVLEFLHPPVNRTPRDSNDAILRLWQETAASARQAFEELTLADLVGEHSPAEPFVKLRVVCCRVGHPKEGETSHET
ncbi:MAG: RrF2 family transcriptional regulator [Terriglobia bacterium]